MGGENSGVTFTGGVQNQKPDAITQGYKEVKERRSPSTDVGASTMESVRKRGRTSKIDYVL